MTTSSAWMQFLAAVLPALAAFLVAALGTAAIGVRNWSRLATLQRQVDIQGDAAHAAPMVIAVAQAPPAGAGGPGLIAAPRWNQLDDPLPDGLPDPEATRDCGEECVAMALSACGLPALSAGQLRVLLGGPSRGGATTPGELVYLLGLFGVKAHVRRADPDAAWVEWQHSTMADFLVIALGYWVSPGYLHWVLIRQTTAGGVTFNDPWGGALRTLSKEEVQKLYCGSYVHIDQAGGSQGATAALQ